ncbi:hypothetical protein [Roseovarius sp. EL26]|uniref:hypothetical protein n=1 Tax=Roseovarius sp. EL26 TaxID=2126672 RepID=UPI000EA0BDDE|nr:hypothetical protein [Roseovarius sp. EL26]
MKHEREMFGGLTVSSIEVMPAPEVFLVRCLRLWCDSQAGPSDVRDRLAEHMGPTRGAICYSAMEDMFSVLFRHSRRRLVRHSSECKCVGADEAILAHFVTTAATGAREDAMLLASLLIEPTMMMSLTESANQVGLHLRRAALCEREEFPDPINMTRH